MRRLGLAWSLGRTLLPPPSALALLPRMNTPGRHGPEATPADLDKHSDQRDASNVFTFNYAKSLHQAGPLPASIRRPVCFTERRCTHLTSFPPCLSPSVSRFARRSVLLSVYLCLASPAIRFLSLFSQCMPASIYRSFSFARWISILPSFNLSLGFLLFYLHVRYAYDKFSISLTSFSHFLRSCFSSY